MTPPTGMPVVGSLWRHRDKGGVYRVTGSRYGKAVNVAGLRLTEFVGGVQAFLPDDVVREWLAFVDYERPKDGTEYGRDLGDFTQEFEVVVVDSAPSLDPSLPYDAVFGVPI